MAFITKYKTYLLFSALLLIVYFPLFLHLTDLPIRIWDESMLGSNAIRMAQTHNYIVTFTRLGLPDMDATKPPLVVWLVSLLTNLFGFSELALRLPSALAGLALCIYLFWFLKKQTGSAVFAFLCVLVLITSRGFIRNHVTRTGEYDAMLVLFSVISALHFFCACHAIDKQSESKYMFRFFVFITLAFLTKGVAALLPAPGLLLYALGNKKVLPFLKNKSSYTGFLVFLVFGIGYYLLRESMNPGFIKAVWNNELGGRFIKTNEGHHGSFTFYVHEIINWQFIPYLYIFPPALITGLVFAPQPVKRLTVFACITGGVFLLVISVSATKLSHYNAIVFPYLAIITATFFYWLYLSIKHYGQTGSTHSRTGIAFTIALAYFVIPYYNMIETVYKPRGDYWEEGFTNACRYFQYAVNGRLNTDHNKLIFNPAGSGPDDVLFCYSTMMKQKGIDNPITPEVRIKTNDHIVIFDAWQSHLLQQKFKLLELTRLDFCDGVVYEVQGLQNPPKL